MNGKFINVVFSHPEAQILLLGLQKDKSVESKVLMRRVYTHSLAGGVYPFEMTEDDLWYLAYLIPLDAMCGDMFGSDVLIKLLSYIVRFYGNPIIILENLMEVGNAGRSTSENTTQNKTENTPG